MIAPQINKLVGGDRRKTQTLTHVTSGLLAGAVGKNVTVASAWALNEVSNNYLNHDQMSRLAAQLKECKTEQCKIDLVNKYKETSDKNLAKLVQTCTGIGRGAANRAECTKLTKEQNESILAYQRGKYDFDFNSGSYGRAALLDFHRTNINEKDTAARLATSTDLESAFEHLGLNKDQATQLAMLAGGIIQGGRGYKGKARGNAQVVGGKGEGKTTLTQVSNKALSKDDVRANLDRLPGGQGANYHVRDNGDGTYSAVRNKGTDVTPLKVNEDGSLYTPNAVAKPKGHEEHHYATDKSGTYTDRLNSIAKKYDLDLNGDWNKDLLPHSGRHPNEYHEFVQKGMMRASNEAGNDKQNFLQLYDKYVKQPIRKNPDLMYKKGWE